MPTEGDVGAEGARKISIARLQRRSEFLRVAAARCKWATPGLILQAAPAADMPPPTGGAFVSVSCLRVGFTCSKKVGNSVARNRARRRLKAAAAQILPLYAVPGYDYVLIGRQETLLRPFSLLLQDLQSALKRVIRKGAGASGSSQGPQNGQGS